MRAIGQGAKEKVLEKYPNARAVQYNNGWQIEISRIVMRATPGLGIGQTEEEAWQASLPLIEGKD